MNEHEIIHAIAMMLTGMHRPLPFEIVIALQDDAAIAHAWYTTGDLKERVFTALATRSGPCRAYALALFERVAQNIKASAAQPWIVRMRNDVAQWPRSYVDKLPAAVMARPAGALLHAIVVLPHDPKTLAAHTYDLAMIVGAPDAHAFVTTHLRPPTAAEIAPYLLNASDGRHG